jgi:hypothetical protein
MDAPQGWENERASALEWLMQDPQHRAIESPTHVDAILNRYAATETYPEASFTTDQFTWQRSPEACNRETRLLNLHLWTL